MFHTLDDNDKVDKIYSVIVKFGQSYFSRVIKRECAAKANWKKRLLKFFTPVILLSRLVLSKRIFRNLTAESLRRKSELKLSDRGWHFAWRKVFGKVLTKFLRFLCVSLNTERRKSCVVASRFAIKLILFFLSILSCENWVYMQNKAATLWTQTFQTNIFSWNYRREKFSLVFLPFKIKFG